MIPPRTVLIPFGYPVHVTMLGTLAADVDDEASSHLMWRTSISLYHNISYLLRFLSHLSSEARIRCMPSFSRYPTLLHKLYSFMQRFPVHGDVSFHGSRDQEFQGSAMKLLAFAAQPPRYQ